MMPEKKFDMVTRCVGGEEVEKRDIKLAGVGSARLFKAV